MVEGYTWGLLNEGAKTDIHDWSPRSQGLEAPDEQPAGTGLESNKAGHL